MQRKIQRRPVARAGRPATLGITIKDAWARGPGRVALLLAALLACGGDDRGPMEPDPTVLQGTVLQAGTQVLLSGVPVTLDGRTVMSGDRGEYRFQDVQTGEATLSASQPGYLPWERTLELEEGNNTFDIPLIPDA